ncbi:unnamed protein product [Prorocentrum cordatum]|uniref:Adenosylmethionine decarboxylase n=1 Tax=Prorocentrum cordatum TaxID=2364126 RepID=A0ABN9TCJ7_9DINO|nr:unnamed protein product [Polarella glacialis]
MSNGAPAFFEGTEKRIEIDFAGDGDLRKVDMSDWKEVVHLSATQILNHKEGSKFTSFLLSESSLIVYPKKAVIKTCGQTTPIGSVAKIMSAAKGVGMEPEWLCYSRKNFLSPAEQPAEHQSMVVETAFCRKACGGIGDAFVLGPMTGEHWFVYDANFKLRDCTKTGDFQLDMMMYGLPNDVQQVFHTSEPEGSRAGATAMTKASGLGDIISSIGGEVDDYCFDKCGYSCNIHAGDAYAMVHVTPQESCSYASFETNIGSTHIGSDQIGATIGADISGSLDTLVGGVLDCFRPERVTITLFIDKGALEAVDNAPFKAAERRYKQKNCTSTHFEQDYLAIIANFAREPGQKRALEPRAPGPPPAKVGRGS